MSELQQLQKKLQNILFKQKNKITQPCEIILIFDSCDVIYYKIYKILRIKAQKEIQKKNVKLLYKCTTHFVTNENFQILLT